MASEYPRWRHERNLGPFANLGHKVADRAGTNLKNAAMELAPI